MPVAVPSMLLSVGVEKLGSQGLARNFKANFSDSILQMKTRSLQDKGQKDLPEAHMLTPGRAGNSVQVWLSSIFLLF